MNLWTAAMLIYILLDLFRCLDTTERQKAVMISLVHISLSMQLLKSLR